MQMITQGNIQPAARHTNSPKEACLSRYWKVEEGEELVLGDLLKKEWN